MYLLTTLKSTLLSTFAFPLVIAVCVLFRCAFAVADETKQLNRKENIIIERWCFANRDQKHVYCICTNFREFGLIYLNNELGSAWESARNEENSVYILIRSS